LNRRAALAACLVAATSSASAQPAPGASPIQAPGTTSTAEVAHTSKAPTQAVSLSLAALSSRSLAAGYERGRLLGDDRFSALGLAGLRRGATGDYSSTTLSAAIELRYWLTGAVPWAHFDRRTMVGAFAGVRLGMSSTTTQDEVDDERIGHTLSVSESLLIGFRFIAWKHLEVTPSTGLQLRHDFELDSRLPPWTRATVTLGLSAGWLF